jgi:hypothetical protein
MCTVHGISGLAVVVIVDRQRKKTSSPYLSKLLFSCFGFDRDKVGLKNGSLSLEVAENDVVDRKRLFSEFSKEFHKMLISASDYAHNRCSKILNLRKDVGFSLRVRLTLGIFVLFRDRLTNGHSHVGRTHI